VSTAPDPPLQRSASSIPPQNHQENLSSARVFTHPGSNAGATAVLPLGQLDPQLRTCLYTATDRNARTFTTLLQPPSAISGFSRWTVPVPRPTSLAVLPLDPIRTFQPLLDGGRARKLAPGSRPYVRPRQVR
jgi:hypothetical protein